MKKLLLLLLALASYALAQSAPAYTAQQWQEQRRLNYQQIYACLQNPTVNCPAGLTTTGIGNTYAPPLEGFQFLQLNDFSCGPYAVGNSGSGGKCWFNLAQDEIGVDMDAAMCNKANPSLAACAISDNADPWLWMQNPFCASAACKFAAIGRGLYEKIFSPQTGIWTATVGSTAGTGYSVGDNVCVTQSSAYLGCLTVGTVNGSGGILTFSGVLFPGVGYSVANNLSTVAKGSSGGSSATVDIASVGKGYISQFYPNMKIVIAPSYLGSTNLTLPCQVAVVSYGNGQYLSQGTNTGSGYPLTGPGDLDTCMNASTPPWLNSQNWYTYMATVYQPYRFHVMHEFSSETGNYQGVCSGSAGGCNPPTNTGCTGSPCTGGNIGDWTTAPATGNGEAAWYSFINHSCADVISGNAGTHCTFAFERDDGQWLPAANIVGAISGGTDTPQLSGVDSAYAPGCLVVLSGGTGGTLINALGGSLGDFALLHPGSGYSTGVASATTGTTCSVPGGTTWNITALAPSSVWVVPNLWGAAIDAYVDDLYNTSSGGTTATGGGMGGLVNNLAVGLATTPTLKFMLGEAGGRTWDGIGTADGNAVEGQGNCDHQNVFNSEKDARVLFPFFAAGLGAVEYHNLFPVNFTTMLCMMNPYTAPASGPVSLNSLNGTTGIYSGNGVYLVSGGGGYNNGDVVRVQGISSNGVCSGANPQITVTSNTGGVITGFNTTQPGNCQICAGGGCQTYIGGGQIPTSAVTGTGSGATAFITGLKGLTYTGCLSNSCSIPNGGNSDGVTAMPYLLAMSLLYTGNNAPQLIGGSPGCVQTTSTGNAQMICTMAAGATTAAYNVGQYGWISGATANPLFNSASQGGVFQIAAVTGTTVTFNVDPRLFGSWSDTAAYIYIPVRTRAFYDVQDLMGWNFSGPLTGVTIPVGSKQRGH